MKTRSDDFEIAREYDFAGGVRGRFYRPKKVSVTLRLDDDVLLYIRKVAGARKVRYQTLLNGLLRDYMTKGTMG